MAQNKNGEKVYRGHARLMNIERLSPTRILVELDNGIQQIVRVPSTVADFIERSWEDFLNTPGESDSPGG